MNNAERHKVFISYYHHDDQVYKDALVNWNEKAEVFIDKSVDTGDISDDLPTETIRQKIRDEYLKDSTVTIVLVGKETAKRKHVDWEIYSSMRDGAVNKKSGIVVILLPSVTGTNTHVYAPNGNDEHALYPELSNWHGIESKDALMWGGFEYIPERIVDSIMAGAKISVTTWNAIVKDSSILAKLIALAHENKENCEYDFSRPMRMRNS